MVQIETLEKLLEKVDIRIVVVNEEFTSLPKSMAVWAKTRGLPLFHFGHSPAVSGWSTVHDTILSDAMTVYGPIEADALMAIGLEDRVHVRGNPDWQPYPEFLAHKSGIRAELLARYFRDTEAPLVVFGTTFLSGLTAMDDSDGPARTGRDFFRAVAALKRRGQRINCAVKLRSNNDKAFEIQYAELAAQEGLQPGDYVFFRHDLVKLMFGADIVVSVNSTLSCDALLADTLAINLYTEEGWWRGPYFPGYSGILECGGEELEACLREAIGNEVLRKRLAEMRERSRTAFQAAKTEEDPAATIADLISKMAFPSHPVHGRDPVAIPASPDDSSQDPAPRDNPREAVRGKTSVVVRPCADIQSLLSLVERLSPQERPDLEIVCMLSASQIRAARASLPAWVVFLLVEGNPHSRENLMLVSQVVTGEFVAFLDAHVRLGEGWDRLICCHLAGASAGHAAVGPLADQIVGTQSVYHYLPMHRVDPGNVDSVSREVRMRYPGMALSADWLYDHVVVFGRALLAEMIKLPVGDSIPHFQDLSLKMKRAGAKLLIAKDVYASMER